MAPTPIEKERNNALKSYEVAVHINITLGPGTARRSLGGERLEPEPSGPTTFEYFFGGDGYRGMDPMEACRQAIAFWHQYLDRIDAET